MDLAPVCLFTYNRLEQTKKTLAALQRNPLAKETHLIIFSDGPKKSEPNTEIVKVRNYLKSVTGFKLIEINESSYNRGLADSIIRGVSEILLVSNKVIVMEDDLITSKNFLHFMNQALNFYKEQRKICSVSGYTMQLRSLVNSEKDYYFGVRASSWGWATWQDRWESIDWEVEDYKRFKYNILQQIKFSKGGSDMPFMLRNQMKNNIDSWAIRWCYHQFKKNMLTVFPTKSKIENIGFGEHATHTKNPNRFKTSLDTGEQTRFEFHAEIVRSKIIEKEFRKMFSFYNRLRDKLS
jgi:hypothetical protein